MVRNDQNDDVIDLLEIIRLIEKNIFSIFFVTAMFAIIGCFYTFVLVTPM